MQQFSSAQRRTLFLLGRTGRRGRFCCSGANGVQRARRGVADAWCCSRSRHGAEHAGRAGRGAHSEAQSHAGSAGVSVKVQGVWSGREVTVRFHGPRALARCAKRMSRAATARRRTNQRPSVRYGRYFQRAVLLPRGTTCLPWRSQAAAACGCRLRPGAAHPALAAGATPRRAPRLAPW